MASPIDKSFMKFIDPPSQIGRMLLQLFPLWRACREVGIPTIPQKGRKTKADPIRFERTTSAFRHRASSGTSWVGIPVAERMNAYVFAAEAIGVDLPFRPVRCARYARR